ncbi:MAG TPA: F0F1 ATP synthase subunit epsilon [Candidatus Krumholzibacteria bacterium]|nr:F0F1 ATP synthase subunit epsilon [Candidatus Krumholzibacteria bacterium]
MRLRIVVPTGTEIDDDVDYVEAEGRHGSFGVYPRHVDFAAALVPGILTYVPSARPREQEVVAIDRGIMVKRGDDVSVSVWRAVQGKLEELEQVVAEQMLDVSEREERARGALERMQSDFVRRFVDLEHER